MKLSDREGAFYNAIIIACIISIVLAIPFFFFMKKEIAMEGSFTELYFTEHKELPEILVINETYDVSFTISNHEVVATDYIYEIDSKIEKFRENISLAPEQEAVITLSITPQDNGWEVESNITEEYRNRLDVIEGVLAEVSQYELDIDNRSVTNYVPISHNVTGFGYIFHTNLSIDGLREKPFNKLYRFEEISANKSVSKVQNITLFVIGDELFLNSHELEVVRILEREPFVVKLYRYDEELGEELDIYFWYEVNEEN